MARRVLGEICSTAFIEAMRVGDFVSSELPDQIGRDCYNENLKDMYRGGAASTKALL